VHVDHVVVAVPVAAPYEVAEHATGEDHRRLGRQGVEQVELDAGERDLVLGELDPARMGVDRQAAHDPRPALVLARAGVGPAQHRPDPGDQLARRERLGDVVVGPDLEADHPVDLVVTRREHEDVGVAEGPDATAHLDAVEAREREVEHDQVRCPGFGRLDGIGAVDGGVHLVALALEQADEHLHELGRILDDEDPGRTRLPVDDAPCDHGAQHRQRARRRTGPGPPRLWEDPDS
jgi:hypothetical protein